MIFAVLMNLRKPRLYVGGSKALAAWQKPFPEAGLKTRGHLPTGRSCTLSAPDRLAVRPDWGSCLDEARAPPTRLRHRLRLDARRARRAGRGPDRARSLDQLSSVVSAAGAP